MQFQSSGIDVVSTAVKSNDITMNLRTKLINLNGSDVRTFAEVLRKCVPYFPGRRRQGGKQVRYSCLHVRASSYRDKSAASELEVRRCRWRCTGSERGERCASPRHQTEPLAADNRTLQK